MQCKWLLACEDVYACTHLFYIDDILLKENTILSPLSCITSILTLHGWYCNKCIYSHTMFSDFLEIYKKLNNYSMRITFSDAEIMDYKPVQCAHLFGDSSVSSFYCPSSWEFFPPSAVTTCVGSCCDDETASCPCS